MCSDDTGRRRAPRTGSELMIAGQLVVWGTQVLVALSQVAPSAQDLACCSCLPHPACTDMAEASVRAAVVRTIFAFILHLSCCTQPKDSTSFPFGKIRNRAGCAKGGPSGPPCLKIGQTGLCRQLSPKTRAKIVSTCLVWYPRSNFSLISSSERAARTSSSASSSSEIGAVIPDLHRV